MRIFTGSGFYVHVFLPNVVCIANFRLANSEHPMKGMCEVTVIGDKRFTCDTDADVLATKLKTEWIDIIKGDYR